MANDKIVKPTALGRCGKEGSLADTCSPRLYTTDQEQKVKDD